MQSGRIYIYAKDVMQLTGKSLRTSQALLTRIKLHFNKQSYQHVTFREFAEYMNVKVEDIISYP